MARRSSLQNIRGGWISREYNFRAFARTQTQQVQDNIKNSLREKRREFLLRLNTYRIGLCPLWFFFDADKLVRYMWI